MHNEGDVRFQFVRKGREKPVKSKIALESGIIEILSLRFLFCFEYSIEYARDFRVSFESFLVCYLFLDSIRATPYLYGPLENAHVLVH